LVKRFKRFLGIRAGMKIIDSVETVNSLAFRDDVNSADMADSVKSVDEVSASGCHDLFDEGVASGDESRSG
jgi:hypothetical protein